VLHQSGIECTIVAGQPYTLIDLLRPVQRGLISLHRLLTVLKDSSRYAKMRIDDEPQNPHRQTATPTKK